MSGFVSLLLQPLHALLTPCCSTAFDVLVCQMRLFLDMKRAKELTVFIIPFTLFYSDNKEEKQECLTAVGRLCAGGWKPSSCLGLPSGLSRSAPANTQLQPSKELMDSSSMKASGKVRIRMVTEAAAKSILRWSTVFFQFADCCSGGRKVVCDEHPSSSHPQPRRSSVLAPGGTQSG